MFNEAFVAAFVTAFITAFVTGLLRPPLTRWIERVTSRRYYTRLPDDPCVLRPPEESFYIYAAFGICMSLCSIALLNGGGVGAVVALLTLPIAVACLLFARGARRLSLRLRPTGLDYTGVVHPPIHLEWRHIKRVEPDGPWFAIRTESGARHLISRNLIGVMNLVDALTANVPAERFSESALKMCTEMRAAARAAHENRS